MPAKYTMTVSEDQTLYTIAMKDTPSSGYAASLHRYLTGSSFRTLDSGSHHSAPRTHKSVATDVLLTIYPNPIDRSIRTLKIEQKLSVGTSIENVRIASPDGSVVHDDLRLDNHEVQLPVLAEGLYYIQFYLDDGRIISRSILVI